MSQAASRRAIRSDSDALPESLSPALAATRPLAELFDTNGYNLYLVGGVVRDALVGDLTKGSDIDCTTDAKPRVVRKIVGPHASNLWTQGERFGTIGCVVQGQPFEITTHRSERYRSDSRKPAVAFSSSLHEDLSRRDFTINAMAVHALDERLIDPYGGRYDLSVRILRTPLDPAISFGDDPLRMLRAARFVVSQGLAADPDVVSAVISMRQRLSIVATERIRDELQKLLLLGDPTRGMQLLFRTRLAEEAASWLAGHDPDVVAATVAAVKATAATRWAALFVDDPSAVTTHMRAMRCSTALTESASALVEAMTLLRKPPTDPPGIRRLAYACRADIFEALHFRRAVASARNVPAEQLESLDVFEAALTPLARREDLANSPVPFGGTEVMALLELDQGPVVGAALSHLRELTFEFGPLSAGDAAAALRAWHNKDYCADR